jgi:amino-acid N-acetyltransferase
MDMVREALHYQSRFSGSTMVFKIDFPVTQDPAFPSFMKDLAILAQTGFKVVIVPGAKEWIDSVLAEYGITSSYITQEPPEVSAGKATTVLRTPLRITAARAMPFVEMAAFHVATRFMTGLSANRTDSVIGNFVRARGLGVLNGTDMESTGRVETILTKPIRKVLDLGMVPVIPCIGWGPSGKPYNVPGDEIALAAAGALGAVKLFIVGLGPEIRKEPSPGDENALVLPEDAETGESGRLIRLTPQETERVLELNRHPLGAAAQAVSSLTLALAASRAGVERVHIIDGREEGAVLRELFSNLGSGTMVYADEYEAIRPLRTQDIPDVLRIMEPLMQQGILIRRSPEDISEKKDDYVVFGVDGRVHALGALHIWGDQGEIAAVTVDRVYADMGLGSRIVRFLINRAVKKHIRRVFILTTKTQDWFETLGFTESDTASLPGERRKLYDPQRKSKVFALELGPS